MRLEMLQFCTHVMTCPNSIFLPISFGFFKRLYMVGHGVTKICCHTIGNRLKNVLNSIPKLVNANWGIGKLGEMRFNVIPKIFNWN